jgi:hypothetical protein
MSDRQSSVFGKRINSWGGGGGEGEKEERSPQVVPSVIGAAVARPERYSRVQGCCSL